MLEYDTNLPQELGTPKRSRAVVLIIAFALTALLLLYALTVLLPLISRHQV